MIFNVLIKLKEKIKRFFHNFIKDDHDKRKNLIALISLIMAIGGVTIYTLLLYPGGLVLQNYLIENGKILENIETTNKTLWVHNTEYSPYNNYSTYINRYGNVSYRLILREIYCFKNPSVLFMYLDNSYTINTLYPNESIKIVETNGLRSEIAKDGIHIKAQSPSLFEPSYSYLKIEREINNYKPNVTVIVEQLNFEDTSQFILTIRNNENFDIEHYWLLLNISLYKLPLFSGYNIYNLTYYDISGKDKVIVPCRVYVSDIFLNMRGNILLPIGFVLPATSVKTIIVIIKNAEPGSIVVWGPMGPPLGLGKACFPTVNETGAYYWWDFFDWKIYQFYEFPFNISDIEVIGNKRVIVSVIPNNNTRSDKIYLLSLRMNHIMGPTEWVYWTYDELVAGEKKTIIFDRDLSGSSHVEIEVSETEK